MPIDFETFDLTPADPARRVWIPLTKMEIRKIANISGLLFGNDAEERNFRFMLSQFARDEVRGRGILIRWKDEQVKLLNSFGQLVEPTGEFVANYIDVPYDPDNELVPELKQTFLDWLESEDQVKSLLHHLATILQVEWSAVKYVLLLGHGRNGKGTLLSMLLKLFGKANISKVKRQEMAALRPTITALNGKLLNLVMDGPKELIKDSSTEKTLIAGEPLDVEMKYDNVAQEVQTNALFIEGLNDEPRVSDKSPALQARLVRFWFPKRFAKDLTFEKKMQTPQMLAAFLHLLLEHWVNEDELSTKLAMTAESLDLQVEAIWEASPVLRWLEDVAATSTKFHQDLLASKVRVETFLEAFQPWLETHGYKNVEDGFLMHLMKENFIMDRKTFTIEGRKTSRRYIKDVMPDTKNAIQILLEGGRVSEAMAEEERMLLEDI